jgi:archaeal type IV pilus assembly protein PilA
MNCIKNLRKFRRNVRAISPVIATLLMIAIAVVASLVTYAWVMGYMNFQTEKTGKAIQIQSAPYNPTTDAFTIYVQNVGDSDVKIDSVFVNGVLVASPTDAILKTQTLSVSASAAQLSAGVQQVTIKVITEDGTFSEITKQYTIQ